MIRIISFSLISFFLTVAGPAFSAETGGKAAAPSSQDVSSAPEIKSASDVKSETEVKHNETPAVEAPKKEVSKSSERKTHGVFGPVLVGPTFTTISVPTVLRVGIETKIYDWFGASIEYGMIPSLNLSGVNVSANATTFTGRVYPFHRYFFVGLGIGTQNIKAKKSQTIQGVQVSGSVDITTPFITPEVGWRWVWKSGFMMGLELGYQISQGATVAVQTDAPAAVQTDPNYTQLTNDIKSAGDQVGNTSLPHFALLQLGYFF